MIGASNFSIPSFLAKILILCQFFSCAYFTFCILTKRIPSKGRGERGLFCGVLRQKRAQNSTCAANHRSLFVCAVKAGWLCAKPKDP
jgi:hypothetical protein